MITNEAKTSAGLFLVHRLEEKAFYEIPTEELGKPMLWVTQLSKTQSGHGYAGSPISDRVVRWELREDTVLLREIEYLIRADLEDPIKNAVEASSVEPILAAYPVAAYGKDKRPVIDVTSLFNTDIPEFVPRTRRSAAAGIVDPKRTFIEKIKAFPRNIETRVLVTYRPRSGAGGMGPSGPPAPSPGEPNQSGVTVELHHSMVKLPNEPMRPRRFDNRVGFFRVTFEDYGTSEQEVERGQLHQPLAARESAILKALDSSEPEASRSSSISAARFRPNGGPGSRSGILRRGSRPSRRRVSSRPPSARSPSGAAKTPTGTPRIARYLVDSLAAGNHRERLRTASSRSAHRRDPRSRYSDVS